MGFFDNITDGLKGRLKGDIDELLKGDGDSLPENPSMMSTNKDSIGRKAIIDDPFYDQVHQHFIFKNKLSRISNKTLKDTSVRDWLVSSIIQARTDTMLRFSRPSPSRLEMGFQIVKREDADNLSKEDIENIANLQDFVYRCGRTENVPPGEEMLFGEYLKLTVRDALTFGHVATEKILTRRGSLHRFRPLPGESVYIINQKTSRKIIEREIENARKTYSQQSYAADGVDPKEVQEFNEPDIEYYKYVQMSYDNRVMAAFGDEDMIFKLFNPQNFSDSMGYCYSPLELAIINITNHLNVENYNSNFFTHGFAARGVLHLKGTVTQPQLTAFRRQFYNTISGTQHAWRTPIVSGLDDVQWVQLSGNARDMEYLSYNDHIMRSICTQFQIDPIELGMDYLVGSTGSAGGQKESNEAKINLSRERGLYPILMIVEDMINNNILPSVDKELAKTYKFQFVGYTDDTPQTEIAQAQAELTVHASLNDVLAKANKELIDHPVASVPLNETFWALVEKNMTRGEIRETFFGDKDASKRRELQYIPADPAFMGWQQQLMTIDNAKKQEEMQQQQMEQQQQQQALQESQDSREQEQHDATMEETKARHSHAAAGHEGEASLKDTAKAAGAATEPLEIGGTTVANPLNSDLADET